MSEPIKDPIEGFQIVGYDESTKKLTIAVDPLILRSKSQEHPIAVKAIEIMEHGPGVDGVEFVPRDK